MLCYMHVCLGAPLLCKISSHAHIASVDVRETQAKELLVAWLRLRTNLPISRPELAHALAGWSRTDLTGCQGFRECVSACVETALKI